MDVKKRQNKNLIKSVNNSSIHFSVLVNHERMIPKKVDNQTKTKEDQLQKWQEKIIQNNNNTDKNNQNKNSILINEEEEKIKRQKNH